MSKVGRLVFTCEHARHAVPSRYAAVGRRAGEDLLSHRGYDPGALELGRFLARAFHRDLFEGRVSRLLVELNRSLHHPHLWSEFSRTLNRGEKQAILRDYYHPYRQAVQERLGSLIDQGQTVMHVSVHSFVPKLHGEVRKADIGLLYDPRRAPEKHWAEEWKRALQDLEPALKVRRNYPYLGVADGFVTHLRKVFDESHYLGIELEVNQKWPLGDHKDWLHLRDVLRRSLALSLGA